MKTSAGLLMYSDHQGEIRVFLAHPGGPFWKKKDNGAWSIPKGEVNDSENTFEAAKREFFEETGIIVPETEFLDLGNVRYKNGKTVHVFGFKGMGNERFVKSNFLELKMKSGQILRFPEIDRAEYFTLNQARLKLHPVYLEVIERLKNALLKNKNNSTP